MAVSLNQIKQRGQQLSVKQDAAKTAKPIKKHTFSPWEDITAAPEKKEMPPVDRVEQVQAMAPVVVDLRVEDPVIAPVNEYKVIVPAFSAPVIETVSNELEKLETKLETTLVIEAPKLETKLETTLKAPKPQKQPTLKKKPATVYSREVEDLSSSVGEVVSFSQVSGVQRKIVIFIFKDCLSRGSLESGRMTVEHLASAIQVPFNSIKKSVSRLEKRLILERAQYKNGRGGWTQYRLARSIYQEVSRIKLGHSLSEEAEEPIKPEVKEVAPQPQIAASDLPAGWEVVDCEALNSIGFTKYHLRQLATQGRLGIKEVQDSINFFAFDLNRNNKGKDIKGNPLNYFMGIVRKGIPYVPPANYVSQEDEAISEYLKFIKAREEVRSSQEREIKSLEFKAWKASGDLTNALRDAPELIRNKQGPMLDAYLADYFDNNVWPTIKNRVAPTPVSEAINKSLGNV